MASYTIRRDRKSVFTFEGVLKAEVVALNHDDSVRRKFAVYRTESAFVAERVDYPDTIDVRYWGIECADILALYQFFGNEPLANYLYGCLKVSVPGLVCTEQSENT